jgi:hypothetical protein
MSVVDRHWVELLVLVVVLGSWVLYERAFAGLRVRHGHADRDADD